jgi:hypothetical protein
MVTLLGLEMPLRLGLEVMRNVGLSVAHDLGLVMVRPVELVGVTRCFDFRSTRGFAEGRAVRLGRAWRLVELLTLRARHLLDAGLVAPRPALPLLGALLPILSLLVPAALTAAAPIA